MSRATAKTLSILRQLIRFSNAHANVRVVNASASATRPSKAAAAETELPSWAGGLPRDTHAFPKMIMDIYRGNAGLTNKAAIKAARAAAADALATFTSAKAQMGLYKAYKGVEVDTMTQREAVARFVGLQLPTVPVPSSGEDKKDLTSKYSQSMAEKASNPNSLTGIDNLKAQLYGVEAVLAEKANKPQ